MELDPVKEFVSLSLYRGIFKTLKNGVKFRTISTDIFIVMDKDRDEQNTLIQK